MAGPFISSNLNPLQPRMLCAQFGWNWPSGSGEEYNVKSLWQQQRQGGQQRWTTDILWSEKLTWTFSSGELKRYNLLRYICLEIILPKNLLKLNIHFFYNIHVTQQKSLLQFDISEKYSTDCHEADLNIRPHKCTLKHTYHFLNHLNIRPSFVE